MNGTEVSTGLIEQINNNAWWVFLSTVIILIGSYSLIDRGINYWNRPKLKFTPKITSITENHDGSIYHRVSFWIHVQNYGKTPANDCHVQISMKDHSDEIVLIEKASIPTLENFLPLKWQAGTELRESINIMPNGEHFASFEIPITVTLPDIMILQNLDNGFEISIGYKFPIEELTRKSIIKKSDRETHYIWKIDVVISSSRIWRQKLKMTIPMGGNRPNNFPAFQNIHFDLVN